jgi:hypothetical protein
MDDVSFGSLDFHAIVYFISIKNTRTENRGPPQPTATNHQPPTTEEEEE